MRPPNAPVMRLFFSTPFSPRDTPRTRRAAVHAVTLLALAIVTACSGGADVTGTDGRHSGGNGRGAVASRIDLSVSVIGLGAMGATETLSALVRDASGNVIAGAPVSWSSADITVADVSGTDSAATITARGAGRTTVRATSGGVTQEVTVNVSIVRAISLPAASQVRAGSSLELSPTIEADAGAATALRWESADPTIATVAGGVVTGVQPGTAIIRASAVGDPRVAASTQLTVTAARSVVIRNAPTDLSRGDTVQLDAGVDVDAGENAAVEWSTSNPTVASITSSGRLVAVGLGTVTVRVQSPAFVAVRDSAVVSVRLPRIVTVTPAVVTIAPGQTDALRADVQIEAGLSTAVMWRSSNPSVAIVASNGVLTGVAPGTATIIAVSMADTTRRGQAVVTVVPMIRGIDVQPTTASVVLGGTRQLSATVSGDVGISTAVLWRSANPSIVQVAANGIVTGVAQGTTTVTAIALGDTTRRSSATVTVIPTVQDLTVQPASASITIGQTRQLAASVIADPGANTAVTWRSSNVAVASVSSAGMVTGIGSGVAMITAVSVADTLRRSDALITVRMAPRVTVSPGSLALQVGAHSALSATVTADPGISTAVSWRTTDPAVATVSSTGVVSAVATGTATITAVSAVDTTQTASATVVVSTAATVVSVSLTPQSMALQTGQSAQLVSQVQVTGGASPSVTYSSNNPAVASVTVAGLVSAIGPGTATITATAAADPSKQASATVVVTTPTTQLAASWNSTRLGGALFEDVVSFDAVDASTAFAVNSLGDVFRLTGGTWALATRGSTHGTQFLAVSAANASSAVAVGTNGVIVRFNGSTWTAMSSTTQQSLNGVHLESATSGFAVGSSGLVLRLSGSTWSSIPSGSSQTLHGVWSLGSSGFAVGAGGEVLRWNGSTWSRVTSGTTETLYGVHGLNGSNVVAVGAFGTVLRWNGSSWSQVTGGNVTADLFNVAGNATDSRFYIASDDGLYVLNSNALSLVATPYAPRLLGASVDGAGNVWTSGQRGSVMRLAGGTWQTVNLAPDLIDVWTTAANNAWAVGEFGFVYRWNGSVWSRQPTPTTATLNAVWAPNATDAFAGGDNGTMLRWNGSSWTAMSFPSSGSVYGLWGTASNNVYAVTSNGEVLRWNGSSWFIATTSGSPLWAVFGSSTSDVYVSGENGTTLRFNGSQWSALSAPTSGTLAGIWSSSSVNVLAVGSGSGGLSGAAFRFTGTSWNTLNTPGTAVLTSVWGANPSDVYATGAGGTMLRWNGSSWTSMSTGTTDLLWSVSGAPTGTGGGFAVGYNSTVVAATGGSSLITAGFRSGTTTRIINLEPRAGAKRTRGSMPTGTVRRSRHR